MNKILKLIMLPSNKKSDIYLNMYADDKNKAPKLRFGDVISDEVNSTISELNDRGYEAYNLYVLSDEKLKEKDYFYSEFGGEKRILQYTRQVVPFPNDKKVIATTDKSLIIKYDERFTDVIVNGKSINTQLPQIPQSFVEHFITEYNKGNLITIGIVKYKNCNNCINLEGQNLSPDCCHKYELKINQDNTIDISTKLYTKEEVIKLLLQFNNDKPGIFDCSNWIKQNL